MSSERLEQAKALFRQGNALLSAGDAERALERFLASRAAMASGKNTANAAICLEQLGRDDEALEMYEDLLARFAADLDAQDRENLAPIMARLRSGLGNLDVSSNVEALVIIDGKPRGRLPRATALRVLPGRRRVRVIKEGYRTFDVTVQARAGDLLAIDAPLEPLSGLGALRVEQSGGTPTDLLVDGWAVGKLPWEGTLRVGTHSLQALTKDRGSKPQAVQVLERRTQLIRLSVRALGPPVRLEAGLPTTTLLLDGAPLSQGSWTGQLPFGSYVFRAEERGYFAREQRLLVSAASGPTLLRLDLTRDPKSARWPQPGPLHYLAGLGGAFMYAPKLNGGHEALCPRQCQGSTAAEGARVEAVLEVSHELGVGVEVGAGYLSGKQSFTRAVFDNVTKVSYALRQELVLGGGYARLAAAARLRLGRVLALKTTLGAGLVAASFDARSAGTAWTTGPEVAAAAFGYAPVSELLPVVTTGIHVGRAFGPLELALGVDAWFVPKRGPGFPGVELNLEHPSCPDARSSQAVGCAVRSSPVLQSERVHGLFAALFPEAGVRYRF